MATSGKGSGVQRIRDVEAELMLTDDESRHALRREIRAFVRHKFYNNKDIMAQLDEEQLEETGREFVSLSRHRLDSLLQPALKSLTHDQVRHLLTNIMRLQSGFLRVNLSHKRRGQIKNDEDTNTTTFSPSQANMARTTDNEPLLVEDSGSDDTSDYFDDDDEDYDTDTNSTPPRRRQKYSRKSRGLFARARAHKRTAGADNPTNSKRPRQEQEDENETIQVQPTINEAEDEWIAAIHLYLQTRGNDSQHDMSNLQLMPVKELLPVSSLSCDGSVAPRLAVSCRKAHFTLSDTSETARKVLFILKKSLYCPESSRPEKVEYEMIGKSFGNEAAEESSSGWGFDGVGRKSAIMLGKEREVCSNTQQTNLPTGPNPSLNGLSQSSEQLATNQSGKQFYVKPISKNNLLIELVTSTFRHVRFNDMGAQQQENCAGGLVDEVLSASASSSSSWQVTNNEPRMSNFSMSGNVHDDAPETRGTHNHDVTTQSGVASNLFNASGRPLSPANTDPPSPSERKLCTDPKHCGFDLAHHLSESQVNHITDEVFNWQKKRTILRQARSRATMRQNTEELKRLALEETGFDAAAGILGALDGVIEAIGQLRFVVVDM